jgi:hypothetical protein
MAGDNHYWEPPWTHKHQVWLEKGIPRQQKREKHTTGGIPRWSPTLVLVARFSAYVWQSGRDAQFSLTYGRMYLERSGSLQVENQSMSTCLLSNEIVGSGGTSVAAVRSLYSFVSSHPSFFPIVLYFVTRSMLSSIKQRW